jgi:deoxyuridine 5'-triphosphate nucleotidohydrolase
MAPTDGYRYIYYELARPGANPPTAKTRHAAGYDVSVVQGTIVWPFMTRILDTGLRFHMDPDLSFTLRPRSSWDKRGLYVHPGLIDADFEDTVKIICRNQSLRPIRIRKGDWIAQIRLDPGIALAHWYDYDEFPITLAPRKYDTARTGGLGSTGR